MGIVGGGSPRHREDNIPEWLGLTLIEFMRAAENQFYKYNIY